MKTLSILLIAISLILLGCKKEKKESNDTINVDSISEYISYGTFFSMCLGYCQTSITMYDTLINFEGRGLNLNVLTKSAQIDKKYWVALIQNIDFENFVKLDSIYGCPDCADGGGEWVKIKKDNRVYRVVFEYQNEPNELKKFIGILRTYKAALGLYNPKTNDFNEIVLIHQKGLIQNLVCSGTCNQYLVQSVMNNDTVYFYDKYLKEDFKKDGLTVYYSGVLLGDSTMIYTPAQNFKVRNIQICDIK